MLRFRTEMDNRVFDASDDETESCALLKSESNEGKIDGEKITPRPSAIWTSGFPTTSPATRGALRAVDRDLVSVIH